MLKIFYQTNKVLGMTQNDLSEEELLAPCGIYCGICKYYHRVKNQCPGCRGPDENKSRYCIECSIKNCEVITNSKSGLCYECSNIPCKRLKNLDKRYSTKYHMSLLENQEYIKKHGIEKFLETEKQKWKCPKCNGIVTCHGGHFHFCFSVSKNFSIPCFLIYS
jgi:hypothetical protein